jgi:fructose-bisphosphate aldolase class I
LFAARVYLEGIVLKPNMVISGKKCKQQASPEEVAEATLRTLKRQVPSAVGGIAFLSGGQSPVEATLHLGLMNAAGNLPWHLTFSYGRALQENALSAWGGKPADFLAGQRALSIRARLNSLAVGGTYTSSMEQSAA